MHLMFIHFILLIVVYIDAFNVHIHFILLIIVYIDAFFIQIHFILLVTVYIDAFNVYSFYTVNSCILLMHLMFTFILYF